MKLFSELKRRNVVPLIEPHLPNYDPVRTEPVFVELVEELGG